MSFLAGMNILVSSLTCRGVEWALCFLISLLERQAWRATLCQCHPTLFPQRCLLWAHTSLSRRPDARLLFSGHTKKVAAGRIVLDVCASTIQHH